MKKFFVIIFSLLFLFFLLIFAILYTGKNRNIDVVTSKNEYNSEEFITLKIENKSNNKVCFSSCNPYFLEILEYDLWEREVYMGCNNTDLINLCINPKEIKAFELEIDFQLISGMYRVSIPYCSKCDIGSVFIEEDILYSNIFEIKY